MCEENMLQQEFRGCILNTLTENTAFLAFFYSTFVSEVKNVLLYLIGYLQFISGSIIK